MALNCYAVFINSRIVCLISDRICREISLLYRAELRGTEVTLPNSLLTSGHFSALKI